MFLTGLKRIIATNTLHGSSYKNQPQINTGWRMCTHTGNSPLIAAFGSTVCVLLVPQHVFLSCSNPFLPGAFSNFWEAFYRKLHEQINSWGLQLTFTSLYCFATQLQCSLVPLKILFQQVFIFSSSIIRKHISSCFFCPFEDFFSSYRNMQKRF